MPEDQTDIKEVPEVNPDAAVATFGCVKSVCRKTREHTHRFAPDVSASFCVLVCAVAAIGLLVLFSCTDKPLHIPEAAYWAIIVVAACCCINIADAYYTEDVNSSCAEYPRKVRQFLKKYKKPKTTCLDDGDDS